MTIILIAISLMFIGYILIIESLTNKTLNSISESFYNMPSHWYFYGFSIAMFLGQLGLFLATENGLFFGAMAGFAFLGMAARYKQQVTELAHFFGTGLVLVSLFIFLGLNGGWVFLYAWLMCSLFVIFIYKKRIVYWIEILAFLFIILGLFIL